MNASEQRWLTCLGTTAAALTDHTLSPQQILNRVLLVLGKLLDLQQGALLSYHRDGSINRVFMLGDDGQHADLREAWTTLHRRGLIGYVYHSRRTITIRDISTDPRWINDGADSGFPTIGSGAGVPLVQDNNTVAVLALAHPEVDFFSETAAQTLDMIAQLVIATLKQRDREPQSEANNPYATLFENAIVPIILTDLDGKIVRANQLSRETLGYTAEQIQNLYITSVHRMGTGPIGDNRFATLQTGQDVEFRSVAWRADGNNFPVIVRARRTNFGDEDLIEWIERDISAQVELETLRSDLTAMIYHDLRNPLQSVQGSLSGLARLLANYQEASVREMLEIGILSAHRMQRLIEDLLDIQRMEEGKLVLKRQPTSLHHVVSKALQLIEPYTAQASQTLTFNLADNLPVLSVDEELILRVITNLVENAGKYSPINGSIKISVLQRDDKVQVNVADSGPGIPLEARSRIFDKFGRVKYTDGPKGIGLGLAFCRLVVEAHGGTIWVESEPGQGAIFSFNLPVKVKQVGAVG